eukprot:6185823-Prymnesium_polylepis.1
MFSSVPTKVKRGSGKAAARPSHAPPGRKPASLQQQQELGLGTFKARSSSLPSAASQHFDQDVLSRLPGARANSCEPEAPRQQAELACAACAMSAGSSASVVSPHERTAPGGSTG